MSTDKMHSLLRRLRGGGRPQTEDVSDAMKELEALEKACQTLADWGVVNELLKSKEPEVDAAADYLYAIGHAYTERTGGDAS